MINHIEQSARQAELDRLYDLDGRHDPHHPHHATYTGLVAGTTTTTTTTTTEQENDGDN